MGERVILSEVCEEIVDCVNRTAPESGDGEYFAVGTPAMRGNAIDLRKARRISSQTFNRWTRRLTPKEGDLLLAREAPVGPVVRIPVGGNIAAGQRTMHLRADPKKVHPRYLYYLLISPEVQGRISMQSMGSTVAHLRVADAKALLLPPLPELRDQHAIAEVLGALDDKITAIHEARRMSVELARARFEKAAKFGIRNKVRDISTLVARGVSPKYVGSGGVAILNQKCVRNHWVSLDAARATDASKTRPNKMLQRDDVLVNSTGFGTLGRVARWVRDIDATADSHVSIVRFDPNNVDPVCAGFGLLRLESQIESLAEGSTGQTELRRDLLASLEIIVPPREEQFALGEELSILDSYALALESESGTLAKTRDELLPLLMSGKIRVRDAERTVEEIV